MPAIIREDGAVGVVPDQRKPATTSEAGVVVLATDNEENKAEAVNAADPRLSNARTPTAHAASHYDGGTDELAAALDARAYPVTIGTLAARPPAATAGVSLYWTSDEHILYRSNGAAWVVLAVADYADLAGIPATFAPTAHKTAHEPGGADALTLLDNSSVKAAAGIVYSKLSLATSIKKGDLSTVLADRPAGDTLTHGEVTADTVISATTQATGNVVTASASFTYDGVTPVKIEFYCPGVQVGAAGQLIIDLWDDTAGVTIGRIASFVGTAASMTYGGIFGMRKITPANGARVYSIRAWRVTANGTVAAGVGGAGVSVPAYIRITKA